MSEEMRMSCPAKCETWARTDGWKLLFAHHPRCNYAEPEDETYEVLLALTEGIEAWAREEDGIYPGVWDAYRKACGMIGKPFVEEAE